VTLARISIRYLARHLSSTVLNVALLAFAVAAVTVLLLTGTQVEERIDRDTRGIDLVVGARGSETQLLLSSVHGLDNPTAPIGWGEAQEIAGSRGVRKAIPLAFGDRYFGFRVVGTTPDYVALHGAALTEGRLWLKPLEAVVGADVASRLRPRLGSSFEAIHVVPGAAGIPHAKHDYTIVGVLGRTGSVLDSLIVTGLESYWTLHPAEPRTDDSGLLLETPAELRTINALLVAYETSHAAADIPYVVAGYPGLQAVAPSDGAVRLYGIFRVALDMLRIFVTVLIASAVLSMFIALYGSLKERRYDIAVMRTLGATRERVMALLLFEGLLLSSAGALLGLLLGHALTSMLGFALQQAQQMSVTGLTWHASEFLVLGGALAIGMLTALVPAWRAHETDIATTLARG